LATKILILAKNKNNQAAGIIPSQELPTVEMNKKQRVRCLHLESDIGLNQQIITEMLTSMSIVIIFTVIWSQTNCICKYTENVIPVTPLPYIFIQGNSAEVVHTTDIKQHFDIISRKESWKGI